MALFGKKKIEAPTMTLPPEENETPEEIRHIEGLSSNDGPTINEQSNKVQQEVVREAPQVQQVPTCISQTQINNIIIENNLLLKHIISHID